MRIRIPILLAGVAASFAQEPEPQRHWEFFKEIDGVPAVGLARVDLDREALAVLREDQGDLRLRDADQREIPYALRVRRRIDRSEDLAVRDFDRGVRNGAAEISIDLGETPPAHNELEIATAGSTFRRRVRVFSSDNGRDWALITEPSFLFRFRSKGLDVDEARIRYPESRRRFLRVEVSADAELDQEPPEIENVSARLAIEAPQRNSEFPILRPLADVREATRHRGRAASKYVLELDGALPVSGLRLMADNGAFSRPFRLAVPDDRGPRIVATGSLARSADAEDGTPSGVEFEEVFAERLILTVTDDRNPPLRFMWGSVLTAAREVVFDPAQGRPPFRLHFGNPAALAPHYDFDASVPDDSGASPLAALGPLEANPDYEPPDRPLTERAPWLAYAALAAACLILFIILRGISPS